MRSLAATILVAAAVGCSLPRPAAPAQSTNDPYRVRIHQYKFLPPRLVVPSGTRVTWVNEDFDTHTATSGAAVEDFDSQDIRLQSTWSHTFTKAGEYPYLCVPHPGMKGIIIVE